jgi:hypothetical protein
MGFLDKIKRSIMGVGDKSDEINDAAARADRTVDDSVHRTERAADDSANKAKRAGNRVKDAADDTETASDDLKKE